MSKERLPEPMTLDARNSMVCTAPGAQDLSHFLPALQVGGEPAAAIPQPSQIDEALDTGVSGGLPKMVRRPAILFVKVFP
jgi:hypothetical protein